MRSVMCNINEKAPKVPQCIGDCYDCEFNKECTVTVFVLPSVISEIHNSCVCKKCKLKNNCKYSKYYITQQDKEERKKTLRYFFYAFISIMIAVISFYLARGVLIPTWSEDEQESLKQAAIYVLNNIDNFSQNELISKVHSITGCSDLKVTISNYSNEEHAIYEIKIIDGFKDSTHHRHKYGYVKANRNDDSIIANFYPDYDNHRRLTGSFIVSFFIFALAVVVFIGIETSIQEKEYKRLF